MKKSLLSRMTPLLAVTAVLASLPASAYTWSIWDGTANWNTAANPPWSAGIPSGTDMGALVRSGTITIDGTSGAPSVNSILLGWSGTAAINMTGGSLTVTGNSGDQSLTIGEHQLGTFTQSGGTVTAALVNLNRGGGAGVYNLNGGTLAAAALNKPGSSTGTLNLNGGILQATAPGAGWFGPNITVNVQAGGAIIDTQANNVGLGSSLLEGGGGLTKNGIGALTLTGLNTYTNVTTINAGTLIYNIAAVDQKIMVISGAGNVEFQGNQNGYYSLISPLANAGTTTVSLTTGSQPWFGTIFAQGVGNGGPGTFSASSVLNVLSGKVDLRCNQTVAGLTGSGGYITTDGAASTVTINTAAGQSYTYSGVVGATPDSYNYPYVSITKTGAGTQILSGINTYTGATTVNGGKLLVQGSLGAGSAVAVNSGGTMGGTGTVDGSVTVNGGGTLGGSGSISGNVTVNADGILAPGETNSVGTLTVSNLVMAAGMVYKWECDTVTSDLTRVLGTISLPAEAVVSFSAIGGAPMPTQGVLFTYGVANSGATDLSGWTVSTPGINCLFTDDAANKQVLFMITAASDTDGVWNKAGALTQPIYVWSNAGNWTNGIVADGTNRIAHFDAVDVTNQYISMGYGSRTIGQLIFNDVVPASSNWWSLCRGTLDLRVTSGSPVIAVSNSTAFMESDLTLTGDFTKTGAGTLTLNNFPATSINIAQGRVTYNDNRNLNFSMQNISGSGEVEFTGQANCFFGFNGYSGARSLTYTGHTIVNLNTGVSGWWTGTLFVDRDDVLPHATVLDLLSGKIYLRNQTANGVTIAGLTGNAGTIITTDGINQKVTLDVMNGLNFAYAGTIGVADDGNGNGNIYLTKQGLGTQILSGANTFVGTLAVSNGTLLVNNATGSGSGINNSVTVAAGATLGGTGTLLSANVTLDASAVLAPGGTNGLGTLTFGGNLGFAAGAVYRANHTGTGSNTVVVAGALTLSDTASVSLSVVDIPLPKQITLFTAGSLAGATELSGWQVSGVEPYNYRVSRVGTTEVVATLLPRGTLIRVF